MKQPLKHRLALVAVQPLLVFSAMACSSDDTGSVATTARAEQDFDALVATIQQREQIPGLSVAIVHDDTVIWSRGYGLADLESKRKVTPDTPFTIASISKTITAVALMQAVEAGTVTLDTPVNDTGMQLLLDNPHLEGETITLRHLATHTSGILDGSAYACSYYIEADKTPLLTLVDPTVECADPMVTTLDEYLSAYLVSGGSYYDAEENFAKSIPGALYSYSNVGAALTGLALGSATGIPFDDYCGSRIFNPLGMSNTHWHRSQFESDVIAVPYTMLDGERIRVPEYSCATWPDGGLRTSANDLARFAGAVMNGGKWDGSRILEPESVTEMLSSQTDAKTDVDRQSIFWVDALGYTGHDGSDPGAASLMFFDREQHTAVVLLANLDFSAGQLELLKGAFSLASSLVEASREAR